MSESLSQTFRRNARVSLLTWFWGQSINLVRMMILIHYLSTDGYGLWIFSFSILSYFVVYNFGIANAFVTYTAECNAKKEYARLGDLLSTGMLFGVLMGLGVVAFFFLFTDAAVVFFNIKMENVPDARFVIFGVALTTAFNMATSVYGAALTGIQRLDLKNYAYVGVLTVEFALLIAALRYGYGIRAVTVLYGANMCFSALFCAVFVRRHLPEVRINPLRPRLHCVRPLFTLGGKMQLLGIVSIMVGSLDVMVFMKYGSESFVGIYGAGQRFAQRAQSLALQGFGMLAPAGAHLIARDEHDRLAAVYVAAQRFTALLCVWVFGYLFFHADLAMRFVMDDEYDPAAAFALQTLCAGYFFHTLTGPGTSMLRGAGKPMIEMVYQVLTAVFFAALFFPLMRAAGGGPGHLPVQLVAAWPAALGAASFIFVIIANRFFRVPLWSPFGQLAILLAAASALAWGVHHTWELARPGTPPARWPAFTAILVTGAAYTLLLGAAVALLPGMTRDDREQMLRFIPGGHRLLRRGADGA